jgi:hypothetical protein
MNKEQPRRAYGPAGSVNDRGDAERASRDAQSATIRAVRHALSFLDQGCLYGAVMQKPPLDPDVADLAPTSSALTGYDEQHLVTYLRLLDAAEDGADWAKVAALVLHIDPAREPDRARRAWESHLARARWMTEHGYRHLLRGGAAH